jgi:hypothetical protein
MGAVKIYRLQFDAKAFNTSYRRRLWCFPSFWVMNRYGDPAGARVSLTFIPGAFAPRLIYDAAAAAKKKTSTLPVFTCFRAPALTRILATHITGVSKPSGVLSGPRTSSGTAFRALIKDRVSLQPGGSAARGRSTLRHLLPSDH